MPDTTIDNRQWTDQPAFLAAAESLCVTNVSEARMIQVMRSDAVFPGAAYYVTAGNLFHSGTIRVRDADDAFKAIGVINSLNDGDTIVAAHHGWTVIPNDQRKECV